MREWLASLPMLGRFFTVERPGAARVQPAVGDSHLNAERERSRQLKNRLQELEAHEASLSEELKALTRQGARKEEKLAVLEEMLGDPKRAQNAIVYYQLRNVWFACHGELAQLVKELSRHLEKEERQQQLAHFRTRQEEEAARLDRDLQNVDDEHRRTVDRRRRLDVELTRAQSFWYYFKRKRLKGEIEALRLELGPVEEQREECRRRIREVQDRTAPSYEGLSVEGRRQINLAAIALAQYLYLRLQKDNVVDMARSARNKAVHEAHFGAPDECLQIARQISGVSGRLLDDQERSDKVRRRTQYLRQKVSFKEKMQTVPDLPSVNGLQSSISEKDGKLHGDTKPLPVNVLEMDLWDMRRVFL